MGFVTTATVRFVSFLSREGMSVPMSVWKDHNIFRNRCPLSSITLFKRKKSNDADSGASVCAVHRRYTHNGPEKPFRFGQDENLALPAFYEFMMAKILGFYIALKLDRNFTTDGFKRGAKRALEHITENLVNKNFSAVKEITSPECFEKLVENIEKLSEKDKAIILFKENALWSGIGKIKLEYPSNGSAEQLFVLKVIVCIVSTYPIVTNGIGKQVGLKFYITEFKRIYDKEKKSPWIVSGMDLQAFNLMLKMN